MEISYSSLWALGFRFGPPKPFRRWIAIEVALPLSPVLPPCKRAADAYGKSHSPLENLQPRAVVVDSFGQRVQHGLRTVKRRRALLESNPPRN